MPTKNIINIVLVLFILVSIPVTVIIARNSTIGSSAQTLALSVNLNPRSQEIVKGGSRTYQVELAVPDRDVKSGTPVLLKFGDMPSGIILESQPIGATKSNNFQKLHSFDVVVGPSTAAGKYSIEIVASDLTAQQKTSFEVVVK